MINPEQAEKQNLRPIHTARTVDAINKAVKEGYQIIVKPVVTSLEIATKYAVLQHKTTGEIRVIHDYRAARLKPLKPCVIPFDPLIIAPNEEMTNDDSEEIMLIDFTYYYPYHFPSPFAAYLIPPDILVGERVQLTDVIEDIVGRSWNQGDTYRLAQAEAIWNGTELIIQFDERSLENNTRIG